MGGSTGRSQPHTPIHSSTTRVETLRLPTASLPLLLLLFPIPREHSPPSSSHLSPPPPSFFSPAHTHIPPATPCRPPLTTDHMLRPSSARRCETPQTTRPSRYPPNPNTRKPGMISSHNRVLDCHRCSHNRREGSMSTTTTPTTTPTPTTAAAALATATAPTTTTPIPTSGRNIRYGHRCGVGGVRRGRAKIVVP